MKKIFQILVVFVLVFILVITVDSIANKTNEKVEVYSKEKNEKKTNYEVETNKIETETVVENNDNSSNTTVNTSSNASNTTSSKSNNTSSNKDKEKLTWKLVDETSGNMCTQSLVKIGEEDGNEYYVSNQCIANLVYIVFSNGEKYSIKEAVEKSKVSIKNLYDELVKKGYLVTIKRSNIVCSAPSYRVSFETNGGNKIYDKNYKYASNKEELPIPTKEGYNFVGWYADKELTKSVSMVGSKLEGAIFTDECYKKTTIYAKWEKKEDKTLTCPKSSTLVKDATLGNICVKSYKEAITKKYPYSCHAVTYTWDCPNTNMSSIDNPSVGCYANALLTSQLACVNAKCTINSTITSSNSYYTNQQVVSESSIYNLECDDVDYIETTYYCEDGWSNMPNDNSKCYISATIK